jgi:tellurite resistance protein
LNPECVTFSIFDDRVDNNTKHKMAERILSSYNCSINNDEEEIEFEKKIALKLEDVSHFIQKDLFVDLINYKSIGID